MYRRLFIFIHFEPLLWNTNTLGLFRHVGTCHFLNVNLYLTLLAKQAIGICSFVSSAVFDFNFVITSAAAFHLPFFNLLMALSSDSRRPKSLLFQD